MSEDLSALWQRHWPLALPLAHTLKHIYPDRWVRFHSLPESQRYPVDEVEMRIVLHRYNTVLEEVFDGSDVRLITLESSQDPEPPPLPELYASLQGDARHWQSLREDDSETDPEFIHYWHLFASRMPWRAGALDDLLRAVADDAVSEVMITSLSLDRIHHPYDGGADILMPTSAERDAVKGRHTDWLSIHPGGF